MANEVLSRGITLSYKNGTGEFIELDNLSEVAELGGDVEAVEVTNLGDGAHRYIEGIKNYGDTITFKFFYDKTQFATLRDLTGISTWRVTLPDDTACTFDGSSSVKLDGVGVNAPISYTLNIKPNSEMAWN